MIQEFNTAIKPVFNQQYKGYKPTPLFTNNKNISYVQYHSNVWTHLLIPGFFFIFYIFYIVE
jgi:hypothetical protein